MSNELPSYADRLDALHRALEDDFRAMVARVPLDERAVVVDAGCGDGFFTALLAERVPHGQVIGLDSSPAFLEAAASRLAPAIEAGRARLVEGDVCAMPFDAGSLDSVWSFHSMQSYEDIPRVLQEFRRVLRPGGVLAVLETDNIHSIMLSWPPDLELAVRQAEHREIGDEDSYIGTYFPRFAPHLLAAAGFQQLVRQYALLHRQPPASNALEDYVRLYVEHLAEQVGDKLGAKNVARLAELADPASPRFLPRQENFFFGSLQVLMTAQTPPGRAGPRA